MKELFDSEESLDLIAAGYQVNFGRALKFFKLGRDEKFYTITICRSNWIVEADISGSDGTVNNPQSKSLSDVLSQVDDFLAIKAATVLMTE